MRSDRWRPSGPVRALLGCGAFAVVLALYCTFILTHPMSRWMSPVDLHVYRLGGEVAAHIRPGWRPKLAAPLYDWPGRGLKSTYPRSPPSSSRS